MLEEGSLDCLEILGWGCSSVIELFPSIHEVPDSISIPPKQKGEKEKEIGVVWEERDETQNI